MITCGCGSLLQAFAGIIVGSYLAVGSALIGPPYLLAIIASAFIGGISLAGGEGSPFGAILGGFTAKRKTPPLEVVYNISKKINSKAIPLKAFWLGNHHLLCRWSFTIYLIENIIVILAISAFWKEVVTGCFCFFSVYLIFYIEEELPFYDRIFDQSFK